jgi:hypothetical protein
LCSSKFALYGLPDFDDRQRLNYLSLSGPELTLASSRPGLHTQVCCALQIGYFKAKHAFFRFTWDDAQEDCTFVLGRYFRDQLIHGQAITKHEHYVQRTMIAELCGYRLWSADFLPQLAQLAQQAAQIVRRDVTPGFIVAELIAWLQRPEYSLVALPKSLTQRDAVAELPPFPAILIKALSSRAFCNTSTIRSSVNIGTCWAGDERLTGAWVLRQRKAWAVRQVLAWDPPFPLLVHGTPALDLKDCGIVVRHVLFGGSLG